jgi:hypothetical protein
LQQLPVKQQQYTQSLLQSTNPTLSSAAAAAAAALAYAALTSNVVAQRQAI